MPEAYTKDYMQKKLIGAVWNTVKYWSELPDKSDFEKCDGLAFSLLVMIDGGTMAFPSMDLILRPHPDDKEWLKNRGENWCEDGMAINDNVQLHELYVKGGD